MLNTGITHLRDDNIERDIVFPVGPIIVFSAYALVSRMTGRLTGAAIKDLRYFNNWGLHD